MLLRIGSRRARSSTPAPSSVRFRTAWGHPERRVENLHLVKYRPLPRAANFAVLAWRRGDQMVSLIIPTNHASK
jgi:hypothetical protein